MKEVLGLCTKRKTREFDTTNFRTINDNVKSKLLFRHTKLAEIDGVQTKLQLQENSPQILFLFPKSILHKNIQYYYSASTSTTQAKAVEEEVAQISLSPHPPPPPPPCIFCEVLVFKSALNCKGEKVSCSQSQLLKYRL